MRGLFASSLLFVTISLAAADLPVRQVVVFKNGIGFVTRVGEVEFNDGRARAGSLPSAMYGGLWVALDGGVRVNAALASRDEVTRLVDATSIGDLLDANDGRDVTLQLFDRTLVGTLRSSTDSSFALIESGGRTTAVPKSEVKSLTADGSLSRKKSTIESESRLEVRADAKGRQRLTIASLERSVGWTPEYSVRIGEDGRAAVSLRAALVNDAADLTGAEVFFAVGYPSFEFAGIRGPLDPEQSLLAFLQSLTSAGWRRSAGPMANVMTQAVSYAQPVAASSIELPDNLTEGERQQDLYLYRLADVSLKSGQRGSYPLMDTNVPFTHTWDWEIEDRSFVSMHGYEESRPRDETLDQVWHSVKLDNRSDVPWTTGPALVIDDGKPIAQSTLHYTPAGASTRLRLTVATDVVARHVEIEKGRANEPLRRFGHTYEGIDVEGTLTITNHRKERVAVDATRTLTGNVASPGEGGRVTRLAEEPSAINPRSKLDWGVPVGPGETRTVRYEYRVWVRR